MFAPCTSLSKVFRILAGICDCGTSNEYRGGNTQTGAVLHACSAKRSPMLQIIRVRLRSLFIRLWVKRLLATRAPFEVVSTRVGVQSHVIGAHASLPVCKFVKQRAARSTGALTRRLIHTNVDCSVA